MAQVGPWPLALGPWPYGNPRPSRRALRRSQGPRPHQGPGAARAQRRRRLHQRPASRAVLRRVDRLRRAPRLRAGRRHPARGLEAVRAHRRYFVKQYEADTNANLCRAARRLEVHGVRERRGDASCSTASFLAASLAYLSHRQRDRVGIVTFDEDDRHARAAVGQALQRAAAHARSREARASRAGCSACSTSWPSTSSAAPSSSLISDLYENPADLLEALKPYRSLGNDVIVFHVLDPAEIDFPYTDASRFQDLESGEEVPVVPEVFAEQYRQMMKEHIEALTTKCSESRIDYLQLDDVAAARRGAVQLPGQPRAADAGAVGACHFLAPLFFVGLAAIAVPILVHLIQRERKNVVEFPSLMFIRRIPYQSVERRRIHNWLLLVLRVGAMVLLVAAFARPFFDVDPVRAAAALERRARGRHPARPIREHGLRRSLGARAGRGEEDRAHARRRGQGDAGALRHRRRGGRARDGDRGRLEAAIDAAKVSSDGTRYAPALRLAQSLLSRSTLPRKEAYLISDFQKIRLGAAGGDPAAGGRDADADLGRDARTRRTWR